MYAFDDDFKEKVKGWEEVRDYWTRASAKPHLTGITVPALILNARNDPFVPAWTLPDQQAVSSEVTLWQPAQGGHVGFVQGYFPGQVWGLADDVGKWLLQASGQQE